MPMLPTVPEIAQPSSRLPAGVSLRSAIAGLLLVLGAVASPLLRSLAAQSPGVRVIAEFGENSRRGTGVGVFVDLDANATLDVRLGLDITRGQLPHPPGFDCLLGPHGDIVPLDPLCPETQTTSFPRNVTALSLSVPVAFARQRGFEWRLVPGVQGARVTGAEEFTQVALELGLETRFTPAATGRFEWIANATAGSARELGASLVADSPANATGSYVRLSLGVRFRLSMQEFSGLP